MIYAYNPKGAPCARKPMPWPGVVFPIPLGHWRGRIYRGLFFGVHGAGDQYSPIWSGVARSIRNGDYYVDNTSRVSASKEWLCGQLAKGATSADSIPLEIHAIEDPDAYRVAVRAYRDAQHQAFF